MSTENTSVEPQETEDNLDDFAADFFGQKDAQPEPASSESEDAESTEESDATEETTTQEDEADVLDEDETDEAKDTPAPKKNRFQERINELTREKKESQRQTADLEARLAALEKTQAPKPVEKAPTPVAAGPSPDARNEDGTDKYPLGEFDPSYVRDLAKFAFQEEREAQRLEDQQREAQKQQAEFQAAWNEKLVPAQERYPDFQEKGQELFTTFDSIDESYGEYLATTIMSLDYGPEVLYYLANNLDEADQIVKSGPTKATIALGRLEALFVVDKEDKPRVPRVSKAPPPPPTNKGASAAKSSVAPDTDDLDAFNSLMFPKKGGK